MMEANMLEILMFPHLFCNHGCKASPMLGSADPASSANEGRRGVRIPERAWIEGGGGKTAARWHSSTLPLAIYPQKHWGLNFFHSPEYLR